MVETIVADFIFQVPMARGKHKFLFQFSSIQKCTLISVYSYNIVTFEQNFPELNNFPVISYEIKLIKYLVT